LLVGLLIALPFLECSFEYKPSKGKGYQYSYASKLLIRWAILFE
jgi:hypothetical protein